MKTCDRPENFRMLETIKHNHFAKLLLPFIYLFTRSQLYFATISRNTSRTDNENLSATVQKQLTKHPHASEKPQAIKTALCICLDGNCCRTDKWTSLRTNMYIYGLTAFVTDRLTAYRTDGKLCVWLSNWLPDQKRSFCARLPSKMQLWSWKTKLLCETSFKIETLKIKNEAFVRDFLRKRSFEAQKRSFCARLPSKMKLWRSKTKHFCETSFKNDMLTARLTSELQYVLAIFKWMLQKYLRLPRKSWAEAYEVL